MYIYESHMGGLYSTEEQLSIDQQRCDCCGDYNSLVCEVNSDTSIQEVVKMIEIRCGVNLCEWIEDCNFDCKDCGLHLFSGGYCKEEVHDLLSELYSEEEIDQYFGQLTEKLISEGPKEEKEYEEILC